MTREYELKRSGRMNEMCIEAKIGIVAFLLMVLFVIFLWKNPDIARAIGENIEEANRQQEEAEDDYDYDPFGFGF